MNLDKVDDHLSSSFNSLKIDTLYKMYKNEEYEDIIKKTNMIIGTVVLPRDDYVTIIYVVLIFHLYFDRLRTSTII